jgi:hypothetical protein
MRSFCWIQPGQLLLTNEKAEVEDSSIAYAQVLPGVQTEPCTMVVARWRGAFVQAASNGANFGSTSYENRELLYEAKSQ